ncbi:glycosyltransferase [Deinococcus sp. Marseille-Q6407]|uniref:glycosyltransferase n=1 Tax=Deinococcus sp. Marseille-Q6407 TaxID=2969223 RepID=UPI0021C1C85F|nr:glycosyltransferase family 2 protein [Deinococcus sp. Marseille-Q6407]
MSSFSPAPLSARPVVVALPARDEAHNIGAALRALGTQRDGMGRPLPVRVALLVNNTADRTAELAVQVAAQLPQLKLSLREESWPDRPGSVVQARRRALDWAAELAGPDGIIASTDADTRPAPDWLWQLTAPLRTGGAAAVQASAGRILLDPAERAALPPAVRRTHLLDSGYRWWVEALMARLNPVPFDPWPRHWQHFGASLALTVQAYRVVGGVPDVSELEDIALVRALRRQDLALRHTPQARVWTSARRSGRVAVGLSTQLQEWTAGPEHWQVPGGAEVVALARAEAALRLAWQGGHAPTDALVRLWRADPAALAAALHSPFLGRALEQAHAARRAGDWVQHSPAVPVEQALREVREELARLHI